MLRVVGDLPAGQVPDTAVRPGEAIRIMTGAPMPPGADAVVRVEDTERGEGTVRIGVAARAGKDMRFAGEDVRAGDLILPRGTYVRPGRGGHAGDARPAAGRGCAAAPRGGAVDG